MFSYYIWILAHHVAFPTVLTEVVAVFSMLFWFAWGVQSLATCHSVSLPLGDDFGALADCPCSSDPPKVEGAIVRSLGNYGNRYHVSRPALVESSKLTLRRTFRSFDMLYFGMMINYSGFQAGSIW